MWWWDMYPTLRVTSVLCGFTDRKNIVQKCGGLGCYVVVISRHWWSHVSWMVLCCWSNWSNSEKCWRVHLVSYVHTMNSIWFVREYGIVCSYAWSWTYGIHDSGWWTCNVTVMVTLLWEFHETRKQVGVFIYCRTCIQGIAFVSLYNTVF